MEQSKNTGRETLQLAFYHHWDRNDLVEDYVVYAIKALKDYGFRIIFSTNSRLGAAQKNRLNGLVEEIIERSNKGFDFGAWKQALFQYREDVEKCKQILLINNSVFGPIFPLNECFDKMAELKSDFWGMTEYNAPNYPQHLQSYFICITAKVLQSKAFWDFWKKINDYEEFLDAVQQGEIRLTQELAAAGFQYHAFVEKDIREYFLPKVGLGDNISVFCANYLVLKYRIPFVKIKAFGRYNQLRYLGGDILNAMTAAGSQYPQSMIYDYFNHAYPLTWQKNLPERMRVFPKIASSPVKPASMRIAVICHVHYLDVFNEFIIPYLRNMPVPFDLLISTTGKENAAPIQKVCQEQLNLTPVIRIVRNYGRDIYPWLTAFRDLHEQYDLCLKIHAKKAVTAPETFMFYWNHFLLESLLGSKDYVSQIIESFARDNRLGMVFPIFPPMLRLNSPTAPFDCLDFRDKFLKMLNIPIPQKIKVNADLELPEEAIFSAGTMFWYRPQALKRLLDFDFPPGIFPEEPLPEKTLLHGLERAIPYIAQADGYIFNDAINPELLIQSFRIYEDKLSSPEVLGMFQNYHADRENQSIAACYFRDRHTLFFDSMKLICRITLGKKSDLCFKFGTQSVRQLRIDIGQTGQSVTYFSLKIIFSDHSVAEGFENCIESFHDMIEASPARGEERRFFIKSDDPQLYTKEFSKDVAGIELSCQLEKTDLSALCGKLQQLDDALRAATGSVFWKMTAPVRKFFNHFKGKHTEFFISSTRLCAMGIRYLWRNGLVCTFRKFREFVRERQTKKIMQHSEIVIPYASLTAAAAACEQNGGKVWGKEWLTAGKTICPVGLFSHDLSLTGAPIALLSMARTLQSLGKAPVIISAKDGPLKETALVSEFPVLILPFQENQDFVRRTAPLFDFAVANTIVSAPVVAALNGNCTPVLWWIHESENVYHSGNISEMPDSLNPNVRVFCVGQCARANLLRHCAKYQAQSLLYAVPRLSTRAEKTEKARTKFAFACIGTFQERKGQKVLLEAVRRMTPAQRKKFELVFAGYVLEKDTMDAMEKAIADFPETVRCAGFLNKTEINDLYAGIDCLICASTDDPMPIVVTEAMQREVSIICSESTGFRYLPEIEQACFTYSGNDPDRLKEKMLQMMDAPPEKLREMKRHGIEIYEKYFSEEVFRKNLNAVITELEGNNHALLPCRDTVTVIIPTFQAGADFPLLIQKLKNQKNISEIEIVIVDSGSTDGTLESAQSAQVKCIRIPHGQFSHSSARNSGAKEATGKYLVFMTQDAFPVGNLWLSKLLQPLLKNEAAAVCCREIAKEDCTLLGRLNLWYHNRFMDFTQDRIVSCPEKQTYANLRPSAQLNDVTCAIKHEVFSQFLYQGNFAEDLDLGVRLLRAGQRLAFLASVGVIHSHNRSPFYYFRRTLTGIETLKKIFPDFPLENVVEGTAANNILSAVAVINELNRKLRNESSLDWDSLLNFIQWHYGEIRNEASRKIKAGSFSADLLHDNDFHSVIDQIWEANHPGTDFDGDLADSIVYGLFFALPAYMHEEKYLPAQPWNLEIMNYYEEILGLKIGNFLAAYAYSAPNGKTQLLRIARENKCNV